MSKGLLAAIAVLFAGAGAALAQTPAAPPVVVGPPAAGAPVASGAVMTTPPIDGPGFNAGVYSGGYAGGYGGAGCGLANCATDCGCPWYGRAEYLLWWTKDMPNSTPLATSVAPNTPTGGTPVP
jgi:hypothetical protein